LELQEILEMSFRRAFALINGLALAALMAVPSHAQDKGQEQQQRKLSGDERREYIALNELVDAVAAGKQPAPADVKLTFQHHFLRSSADNVYLPYTVQISGGKFSSFPVAMYVRVAQKPAAGAPAPAAPAKQGDPPPDYPFADVYFLTEQGITTAGDVAQVSRALQLTQGEYTLYIAMRERQPRDRKLGPPKSVVMTQPLSVPDLGKGLTTSSVIVSTGLDPAAEKLTAQQQLEQPFTISGYRITPVFSAGIPQSGEFLFVFFIYNEGIAASGKPDLDVDYHFFRAAEEKPFTRLATQSFNATTLPGQFDLNAGHQVFVGQGIPLKSDAMTFAPGDYRMEIKITDKTNGQSITRSVPFTVTAG
jgi:hypothetical protein